jgi:hypothetical protein
VAKEHDLMRQQSEQKIEGLEHQELELIMKMR